MCPEYVTREVRELPTPPTPTTYSGYPTLAHMYCPTPGRACLCHSGARAGGVRAAWHGACLKSPAPMFPGYHPQVRELLASFKELGDPGEHCRRYLVITP